MKNDARLNLRLDADTERRFSDAVRKIDAGRAQILRDLLRAAADYIDRFGRWYPPRLEPDIPVEVAREGFYPTPRRSGPVLRVAEPPVRPAARSVTKNKP